MPADAAHAIGARRSARSAISLARAIHADYRLLRNLGDQVATARSATAAIGGNWLAEGFLRYYTQGNANFYSDNAATETTYVSRNRQLGSYSNVGAGGKVSYSLGKLRDRFDTKLVGAYEYNRFSFSDFTDIRTGAAYRYGASIFQLYVSATF